MTDAVGVKQSGCAAVVLDEMGVEFQEPSVENGLVAAALKLVICMHFYNTYA